MAVAVAGGGGGGRARRAARAASARRASAIGWWRRSRAAAVAAAMNRRRAVCQQYLRSQWSGLSTIGPVDLGKSVDRHESGWFFRLKINETIVAVKAILRFTRGLSLLWTCSLGRQREKCNGPAADLLGPATAQPHPLHGRDSPYCENPPISTLFVSHPTGSHLLPYPQAPRRCSTGAAVRPLARRPRWHIPRAHVPSRRQQPTAGGTHITGGKQNACAGVHAGPSAWG